MQAKDLGWSHKEPNNKLEDGQLVGEEQLEDEAHSERAKPESLVDLLHNRPRQKLRRLARTLR
jgi:hypothetical protein